jgi:putative glutamine amidotransferase
MKRIGISQRLCRDETSGEKRDCLAHDWYAFLSLLGVDWTPLPNHRQPALRLCNALELDGIILTGGDDIGVHPERDETEYALLAWARERVAPAIGVCRGFQIMHIWLGGALQACSPAGHRAQRHVIRFTDGTEREVNSFHAFTPQRTASPPSLEDLAICTADGTLEAASSPNMLGIMWHPEREPDPALADIQLFRYFLKIV